MANYDLTYVGSRVQSILDTGNSLKDAGYIFRGEATPSTVPGTPTERVAYIGGPGTYTNFGSSITVGAGCICVFKYTGSAWSNQVINTGLDSAVNTLQNAINTINSNIGNGYVYAGVATPSTSPVTGKVFYLAVQAGTYTNFGSAVVTAGLNVLKYNGSAWSVDQVIAIDAEPTQGSANMVKSGGVLNSIIQNGPAFDLSAYNAQGGVLATYADLSAALTALNALPADFKKGGMSMKFVLSSDNKYVQFRLMSDTFNTTPVNWQGVDDIPTTGSKNLVTSGGAVMMDTEVVVNTTDVNDIYMPIPSSLNHKDLILKVYNPNSVISSYNIQLATYTAQAYITQTILSGNLESGYSYFNISINTETFIRFYIAGTQPTGIQFTIYQKKVDIVDEKIDELEDSLPADFVSANAGNVLSDTKAKNALANLRFGDGELDNAPSFESKRAVNSGLVYDSQLFKKTSKHDEIVSGKVISPSQTVGNEIALTNGDASIVKIGPLPTKSFATFEINNTGSSTFVITDTDNKVLSSVVNNTLPTTWNTAIQDVDYYVWIALDKIVWTNGYTLNREYSDIISKISDKVHIDSDGNLVDTQITRTLYIDTTPLSVVEELGTGWTKDGDNYVHSGNSREPITLKSASLIAGRKYLVKMTIDTPSAGESLKIQMGDTNWVNPYNGVETSYNAFIKADDGVSRLYVIPTDGPMSVTISELHIYRIYDDDHSGNPITLEMNNVTSGTMQNNLSGWLNVSIGPSDNLRDNINASRNIAIGYSALRELQNGNRNIGIGTFPAPALYEGIRNIAMGADAMFVVKKGNQNTIIGAMAMGYGNSDPVNGENDNTAVGAWAMRMHQAGASRNVAMGYAALNYSGLRNVGVGFNAAYYTRGKDNVAVGNQAMAFNLGDDNVIIGSDAKGNATNFTTSQNRIVIGKGAVGTKDCQVVLGNTYIEETQLHGDIIVSGRDKLQSDVEVNDIYMALNPTPSGSNFQLKVMVEQDLINVQIQLATYTASSYVTTTIHDGALSAGTHYFEITNYNNEGYLRFNRYAAYPTGVSFSTYGSIVKKRLVFNSDNTLTWETLS